MRKYIAAALVLFSAGFQACDKDETPAIEYRTVGLINEIVISDIKGDYPDVSDVDFVARFHVPYGGGTYSGTSGEDARIMMSTPFDAKSTKLTLPENPPQALFCSITEDIPAGFEISDPEANTISFTEIACTMSSTSVLDFFYLTMQTGMIIHTVKYIYCDRPVTITGTGRDWWGHAATYDLRLEEGWNMTVEHRDHRGEKQILTVDNSMPVGMEWKCDMWIGGR